MTDGSVVVTLGVGGLLLATFARPSKHFSWAELTTTSTGLPNVPTLPAVLNLKRLAVTLLEPIREVFGPTTVNSAYRSPAVNAAVDGAANSDHLSGNAADLEWPSYTNEQVAEWLWANAARLPLKQVIVEHHTGHLHVAIGNGVKPEFLQYDGHTYSAWAA